MYTYDGIKLMKENQRRRERQRQAEQGMKYFTFDVDYGGDDVFPYYFRAKSEKEVAKATGVDLEYIFPCHESVIRNAIRHGKHVDTVLHGKLIEKEYA